MKFVVYKTIEILDNISIYDIFYNIMRNVIDLSQ